MEQISPVQGPIGVMEDQKSKQHMMKPISGGGKNTLSVIILSFVVVLAGIGTGWLLSGRPAGNEMGDTAGGVTGTGIVEKKDEMGVEDTSDFDAKEIEGKLVEGGIEGEGTYHLERTGGPSQNVYLTSSVVDLQSFVGKKVKIWGQIMSGKTAGFLVDVGKIKVVE